MDKMRLPWGGVGRRLYVVEALATPEQEPPAPYQGRPLGLDPMTLQVEAAYPLTYAPTRLAIAPDGDEAYTPLDGTVIRTDFASGREQRLAVLPGTGLDLAVTAERIYVAAGGSQDVVWALARSVGARVQPVRVGRGAVGLVNTP